MIDLPDDGGHARRRGQRTPVAGAPPVAGRPHGARRRPGAGGGPGGTGAVGGAPGRAATPSANSPWRHRWCCPGPVSARSASSSTAGARSACTPAARANRSGRATPSGPSDPPPRRPPPADLVAWPPAGATGVPVEDAYAGLSALGLDHGPLFRGLKQVWRQGDTLFAEAELPASEGADQGRFRIHPALLHAALLPAGLGRPRRLLGARGPAAVPLHGPARRLRPAGRAARPARPRGREHRVRDPRGPPRHARRRDHRAEPAARGHREAGRTELRPPGLPLPDRLDPRHPVTPAPPPPRTPCWEPPAR